VATTWQMGDRHGVSFRAGSIAATGTSASTKAPASA